MGKSKSGGDLHKQANRKHKVKKDKKEKKERLRKEYREAKERHRSERKVRKTEHKDDEETYDDKAIEEILRPLLKKFTDLANELPGAFEAIDQGEDLDISELESEDVKDGLYKLFKIFGFKKIGSMIYRKHKKQKGHFKRIVSAAINDIFTNMVQEENEKKEALKPMTLSPERKDQVGPSFDSDEGDEDEEADEESKKIDGDRKNDAAHEGWMTEMPKEGMFAEMFGGAKPKAAKKSGPSKTDLKKDAKMDAFMDQYQSQTGRTKSLMEIHQEKKAAEKAAKKKKKGGERELTEWDYEKEMKSTQVDSKRVMQILTDNRLKSRFQGSQNSSRYL